MGGGQKTRNCSRLHFSFKPGANTRSLVQGAIQTDVERTGERIVDRPRTRVQPRAERADCA